MRLVTQTGLLCHPNVLDKTRYRVLDTTETAMMPSSIPTRSHAMRHCAPPLAAFVLAVMGGACSVQRTGVDILGNALSGGGGVFMSDEDPELVREAIPFGLKTYESLLAVSPDHRGLLTSAAGGFIGYAYILGQDADMREATDIAGARALRARASRLFLRGRDFALRGLEASHPGFRETFAKDRTGALAMTDKGDVVLLYWAGAGWASALANRKGDTQLIADLPAAGALVARILELDETYDFGSAHDFMINYEGGRPGGSTQAARAHYQRALELSHGERASVHLALAESVALREQNAAEFHELIRAALAVDPDRAPQMRLANTLAIRRAQWLEKRQPLLFVSAEIRE